MLPPIELGKIELLKDFPIRWNPKNLSEYELMCGEIAKIESLQGESVVDWEKVENNATIILQDYAKDIPAAAYLTIALSQNHGWIGWYIGTTILSDILSLWWDVSFPPVERQRARVNSINWWHHRSLSFFSKYTEPVTSEFSKEVNDLITKMGNLIKTLLPDANSLYSLHEALRHVPIIEPSLEINVLENKIIETQAEYVKHTTQGLNDTIKSEKNIENISVKQTPTNQTITSATAIQDSIANGQKILFTAAQQYLSLCFSASNQAEIIHTPLVWKAFYIYIWGRIQKLPPVEDLQTLLPAPDADRVNALFLMLDAEKYEELIRACVFFAPESPFCLNIQYLLCEAFTRIGARYATVLSLAQREIREFILRLKGVEFLCFSNEEPFANTATKEFLTSLASTSQNMEPSDDNDPLDIITTIRSECADNIAKKDFFGAMQKMHKKAHTLCGADLLKLQLEEIRLLLRNKHMAAAVAISYKVEASLDFHRLEEWDLALSQEALKVLRDVWSAQKKSDESTSKLTQILARLYCLNPSLAF